MAQSDDEAERKADAISPWEWYRAIGSPQRVLAPMVDQSEPAFRLLFDTDESLPMEYVDTLENLMRNLSSADSEAYSAIFIEFSSAKGKPEDYFKRSRAAVGRAKEDWKQLMGYLKM